MSNVYAGQNIDTVLKIVNKIYSNFSLYLFYNCIENII